MNALKRLVLAVLLAFGLAFGGVQSAAATPVDMPAETKVVADAAQCYDVYTYSGTWYGADGSVIHVYEYAGTWCPAQAA